MRLTVGLLLLGLPAFSQQSGIVVEDIFGRVLNQAGLTLVDWDGYMANPAIRFFVVPPGDAKFPAIAVLSANEPRLYFDLPSTAGADGPRKTISFANASTRVAVYLGNAPDRDSNDGFFTVTIHFAGADGRSSTLILPVHEIDQDRNEAVHYQVSADFSRDVTGFFTAARNRAPIEQALADWSYYFDDMTVDSVPAGQERTLIWGPDGFKSSRTVTNRAAFAGTLLYVYGIHSDALRSGGEPSAQGKFQTSRGVPLPLHRSGGVEVETAGNFNSLGWLTDFSDPRWWASANQAAEPNELFSIAHHESGHALAFNPAQVVFAKFKKGGCLNDATVMAYHGGACLKIDGADHFDGETDDESLFGAFGNEYHGRVPARRWFITKLDLLAAQAVGWKLRRTSALLPVSIVTANLPAGLRARAYQQKLTAQGGIPFYNWTLASGALPDGLRLDSFSGAISGTPTRTGTFAFTVRLQEYKEGTTGITKELSIAIGAEDFP